MNNNNNKRYSRKFTQFPQGYGAYTAKKQVNIEEEKPSFFVSCCKAISQFIGKYFFKIVFFSVVLYLSIVYYEPVVVEKRRAYSKDLIVNVNTNFEGVNIEMIKDYNGNQAVYEVIQKLKVSNFHIHKLNKDKIISLFSAMGFISSIDKKNNIIQATAFVARGNDKIIELEFNIGFNYNIIANEIKFAIHSEDIEKKKLLYIDNFSINSSYSKYHYITGLDINTERIIIYALDNITKQQIKIEKLFKDASFNNY